MGKTTIQTVDGLKNQKPGIIISFMFDPPAPPNSMLMCALSVLGISCLQTVDWRNLAPVQKTIPFETPRLTLTHPMHPNATISFSNIKCGVSKGMVFQTDAGFRQSTDRDLYTRVFDDACGDGAKLLL